LEQNIIGIPLNMKVETDLALEVQEAELNVSFKVELVNKKSKSIVTKKPIYQYESITSKYVFLKALEILL